MRFGVVVFPGSNCEVDAYHALRSVLGQETEYVWHKERSLDGLDVVILPGGFSYGDYLRPGAIARFSPIMQAVHAHAAAGRPLLGICNGFQVLVEAQLLPGALLRNRDMRFVCQEVALRVERTRTPFTCACRPGQVLRMPVAHGEGNYFAEPGELDELESRGQVVFRYCEPGYETGLAHNPNGSARDIAGICNRAGTVVGLMPHPERSMERWMGREEGRIVFESVLAWGRDAALAAGA